MHKSLHGRRRVARLFLWREYVADGSGSSATEFAIVLPVFLLLLFAIIQFGIVFNRYIELANGVAAGARELSISRGAASPYTNTVTAIHGAAPNLNSFAAPISGQSLTLLVAGTACTSANQAGTCAGAFAEGASAVVTATYPCSLVVMWVNLGNCALTTSSTQYIQ